MTGRTSAELIEGYIGRLKAELTSVGAAETSDLVAEVRSLLIDAAGDDAERAAAEIARFGEPAELAAGILAERGLTTAGGMSTAEWWRMGIAVPIDIAIGVSVPLAAALPAYEALTALGPAGTASWPWPFALAVVAFFLGSLAWPWYVWRPWRLGGPRATAGMALTGLAVVRAPGFRRVVRTRDLATLGLAVSHRGRLAGLVTLVLALLLILPLGGMTVARMATLPLDGSASDLAGTQDEQARGVTETVEALYATLTGTTGAGVPDSIGSTAACAYGELAARSLDGGLTTYAVGKPRMVAQGVWTVEVKEKTASGSRSVFFTLNRRVILEVSGDLRDWVITDIVGDGLSAST